MLLIKIISQKNINSFILFKIFFNTLKLGMQYESL